MSGSRAPQNESEFIEALHAKFDRYNYDYFWFVLPSFEQGYNQGRTYLELVKAKAVELFRVEFGNIAVTTAKSLETSCVLSRGESFGAAMSPEADTDSAEYVARELIKVSEDELLSFRTIPNVIRESGIAYYLGLEDWKMGNSSVVRKWRRCRNHCITW